ncbi:MAG TPA: hypothetical protein PKW58_00255 [Ottowia sp.]|uniref:hypothetical protein n=1 Tax=Ottowia sp. TaxID=1898956 RepID=UPI002B5FED42|nr:hypothetical protein [Ottowia sp.]HRN74273.1 hypothetical protein [Ottowia sp.]
MLSSSESRDICQSLRRTCRRSYACPAPLFLGKPPSDAPSGGKLPAPRERAHRPGSACRAGRQADREAAGHRATVGLLERQPQIDAICALVDAFATGALRAVLESGRRVPGDVMLATRYDGLRVRLEHGLPGRR